MAASGEPADVAVRFATALAVCDALLNVVSGMPRRLAWLVRLLLMPLMLLTSPATAIVTLPILLYVNELREQCSIPRICLTDQQILDLIDTRANAGDTLTATAEYIAPLAGAEWTKHRDDVLWNPDEAKKKAKEEDEKRNKEALAAKFAHIKDDPGKETVEL